MQRIKGSGAVHRQAGYVIISLFRSNHFSRITYCIVESDGGHESHEGYDGNESNESCAVLHQCQPLALIAGGLPKHFRAGAGFQVVSLARGAL